MSSTADALQEKRLRAAKLLLARGLAVQGGIPRRRGDGPAPLSFAQQRLWFLDRLVPGSAFYNVPAAIRIRTPFDDEVVRRTLQEIVRRHEVLRTSLVQTGTTPSQIVAPVCTVPFEVRDLRGLAPSAREAEAVRLATEDAIRPFDLTRAPLIRAGILRMGEHDRVFLLNMHHIAADGWSMGVLVDEFRQLYAAFAEGRPSPLPELPIQYTDFAVWQQERLASGALDGQIAYWTRTLANLPNLEMPTDFPHRDVQGFAGETLYVPFPRDLSAGLHAFSRSHGTTAFVTLLAGFNALLHRYSGQDDIVVGEVVANRNRTELEGLIGFFVNSLVLRTDVSGDPTFRELLQRSRGVVLDADENQEVPFEVLVERLRPERSMGRNPLFQVSLQYFSGTDAISRTTLPEDMIHVDKGTASLDLAFDLIESEQGMLARVEFSTELFRRETVQRMIAHYQNLLRDFIAHPDRRVSQAAMLSEEETRHVLTVNAAAPAAPFVAVHELVEAQMLRTPGAVALDDGTQQLTYAEMNRHADGLARRLRAAGVGAESIVAVCLDRSIDAVVSVLAVWKAGGAYTPLDPALPEERFRFVLSDARPAVVITREVFAPLLRDAAVPVVLVEQWRTDDPVCPEPEDRRDCLSSASEENLAYVIYTSGSTGTPKGVMIAHGAISRHLQWMQQELPLSPADRTLFKYSFSFDVAVLEMFSPLVAGARLFVVPGNGPLDIAKLARLIHDRSITTLDTVPSMLALLLDHPAFTAAVSLRRVICGGEVMPAEWMNRLLATLDVELVNMYGPTEATISATYWRTREPGDSVPIGRAAGPCSALILDANLNPLPAGIPGELYLGGHSLARGYLNRPDLTRQRFPRDPFAQHAQARLYRTGDRCRLQDDGTIEFLGRIDEMVKIRGHRVELGEIESALAASPLVRVCAAAIVGEAGREQLAAYVVPNRGAPELWPSIGEYFVYDELLYQLMTNDRVRMQAYRSAIERAVRGKVAVDVGTGADLALARMCLDAGARRVYAIEMLDSAYTAAKKLAAELDTGGRLVLVHGDARTVELPEKADVCVSELIGTIGSSEGVIPILNDARRFLRSDGTMIPLRCVTRVAAVSMPGALASHPELHDVPRHYTERVFESLGRRFDVRMCVKNLPPSSVVSDTAVFEDLSFDRAVNAEESTDLRLTITRDCTIDGLLLWIQLHPGTEELIDVMRCESSWLPVFLPAFSPGVAVKAGDTISAVATRLHAGQFTPDYLIRGSIRRGSQTLHELAYESLRDETRVGANPFYAALHRSLTAPRSRGTGTREHARVDEWAETYDRLYASDPALHEDDFDIVGWNSSYTGDPLSVEEMREQVDGTTERIRALGGKRILEIGCGTGLLLLRLAGDCDRYTGTDFSQPALDRLRGAVERRQWSHVELWPRRADDFSGIEPGAFDVVVLNSVIQYFPGIDYLLRVLEGAARAVRPGGAIFVGDVRNLRSLKMLHAGIELARTSAGTTAGELRERLEQRGGQEVELLIDPELFQLLPGRFGGVTASTVQVKRARHRNELTKFRYDAVLHVGEEPDPPAAPLEHRWTGIEALRHCIADSTGAVLVRGAPSALLETERRLLDHLHNADDEEPAEPPPGSADGVEPLELWELARGAGREVQVTWSRHGGPSAYDILFAAPGKSVRLAEPHAEPKPWSAYANVPLNTTTQQHIVHNLREHLRRKLPEYMVPSSFICLDALPLTPTGKLNRRALPVPNHAAPVETVFAAPETGTQKQIAAVWRQVIGIEQIGIDANFFNIGGHSLLATQVVARLGDAFGIEIPLRLMFEKPTIRGFAEAVEELLSREIAGAVPRVIAAQVPDVSAIDPARLTDEQVNALLVQLLGSSGTA